MTEYVDRPQKGSSTTAPGLPTLMEGIGRELRRVYDIRQRLASFGDLLLGAEPKAVPPETPHGGEGNLDAQRRRLTQLLDECDQLLTRIGA